jgi:ubiquitin-protein ligase
VDSRRLEIEILEMKRRFPQFRPLRLDNGRIGYVGALTTRSNRRYEIAIVYSDVYPYEAPKVYVISPRIESKHMFKDGSICFHLPNEWSPSYTVCAVVGWASHWLHAHEEYIQTGNWPGREAE